MLGEGARTERDAERYLASYLNAIPRSRAAPAARKQRGISIKLSALFSRYEDAQRERVFASWCHGCGPWSTPPRAPT
jgi:RHH-type proline utilization regulon transcriptional repressor/proline dehydrogenase/delta 1-pyrroline-5-carboxylate dehydrogenase